MNPKAAAFEAALRQLAARQTRYRVEAFRFVGEAVPFAAKRLKTTLAAEGRRHIRGQELLDGFGELARLRFGCLAHTVLADWGIRRSEDVGEIVFLLVNHQLLGSSPEDSPADFANGPDFDAQFLAPHRPPATPPPAVPPLF